MPPNLPSYRDRRDHTIALSSAKVTSEQMAYPRKTARLSSLPAIAGLPGRREHQIRRLVLRACSVIIQMITRTIRRLPPASAAIDGATWVSRAAPPRTDPSDGAQRPTDLATGRCARDDPCVTLSSSLCCDEPLVTLAG